MNEQRRADFAATLRPPPLLNVWQWCEVNVDFARAPSYETPFRERYDAGLFPYWREPAEAFTDPLTREIVILKNSRAGATEACILNPLRYVVAVSPGPSLYVTSDQRSAEDFLRERIVKGLQACPAAWRYVRRDSVHEHYIDLPHMPFRVVWPRGRGAFRQHGYAYVFVDEFSCYQEQIADVIRKRTDTYRWGKIVWVSSPDATQRRPSESDPIFAEYWQTDQRKWHLREPGTGEWFVLTFGGPDSPAGIKWDTAARNPDGSWNLDAVRDTAHYITPGGKRLSEADRWPMILEGEWRATAPAVAGRRGYHIWQAYMPPVFGRSSWGEIAVAWLRADAAGMEQRRTFRYEWEAEPWAEARETPRSEALAERAAAYDKGERADKVPALAAVLPGKKPVVVVTVDVQLHHTVWVARCWWENGDSALIDWGYSPGWDAQDAVLARVGAQVVLVDNSFEGRRGEVFDWCLRAGRRARIIPCYGRGLERDAYELRERPALLGTARQTAIPQCTFNADTFKWQLFNLIAGRTREKWLIYRNVEITYQQQLVAEEWVDGAWVVRRGHRQNHLWDCEVLQVLGAAALGYYRLRDAVPLDAPVAAGEQASAALPSGPAPEPPKPAGRKVRPAYVDPKGWRV